MRRHLFLACMLVHPLLAHGAELAPIQALDPGVKRIAVDSRDPSVMAAATCCSVHLSRDAGASWQPSLRLPAGAEVASLALLSHDQDVIMLTGTSQGLMGSFDAGRHWKRLRRNSTGCQAVALHAQNIALAACGGEVLVSHDRGQRWAALSPPTHLMIRELVIDPADPSRAYALTNTSLWAGNLTEQTWQEIYADIRAEDEAVEELHVEDENGETDSFLHHLSAVALDPAAPGTLYLSGTMGILRSYDRGATWRWVPDRGLPATAVGRLWLQRSSPLTVYAATDEGIAALPSDGDRWTLLPVPGQPIHDLVVGPESAWIATDQGLYKVPLPAGGFLSAPQPSAHELLSNFVHEPTMAQVREVAIRYAEVHPEKIKRWRRQASLEAFMPTLSFGYDSDTATNNQIDEGTFPNFQRLQTVDEDSSLDASVNWDLGELIWNNDQTSIDVRSKLMVELRDDIVDEVTRAYFDRRRLQIDTLTKPSTDQQAQIDAELRLQELTARLDGLTGGYFSANTGIHE